jgi:phosphate:Na+ symporter
MEHAATGQPLEYGAIVMGLVGGLALFLYGMSQLTEGLKLVAGERMKDLLARMTGNRFKGLFAGAAVTAVIQSSSVTTVLIVGFISAGLMNLQQSIGVILGAGIGTTITVQIVAFKITHYALALVAAGFGMMVAVRRESVRYLGRMVLGLGLVFYGMEVMSEGASPLRDHAGFIDLLSRMENPFLGVLASALFTALVQASAATLGVAIVLARQGLITLDAGIALVLGANIGTCVTAMLAAIGRPREAVRAAVVHVLFKIAGVILCIGFVGGLAAAARYVSPAAPELDGAARLAAETPRQIANAHTIFNVGLALLFIGFTDPIARLVRRILPDRVVVEPALRRPMFLEEMYLETPDHALDRVRLELGRLGENACRMIRDARVAITRGSRPDLDRLAGMDDDVDALHGAIVAYLGQLSTKRLTSRQRAAIHDLLSAANYLENVGDMVQTNLVDVGLRRLRDGFTISPTTLRYLDLLHGRVSAAVEEAVQALVTEDRARAALVIEAKDLINRLSEEAEAHLATRLTADASNRLAAFRLESEVVEHLKRTYYFAKRIAKIVLEAEEGEGTAGEANEPAAATAGSSSP